MMSKNSYSASNLWKENLKHKLWAIALSLLFAFFEYIVAAAGVNSADSAYHHGFVNQYLTITRVTGNIIAVFMYMFLGLLLGISSFSYLFNERETAFYHSLPIKRNKLYVINVVNSILIVAIPAIVMSELGALIVGTVHGERMTLITWTFVYTLIQLVFFICSYMTAMIAAQLTGNIGTAIAAALVFIGYGPAIYVVYHTLMGVFETSFYDFSITSMDEALRFSPALYGFAHETKLMGSGREFSYYIPAAIIISILLFCLGYFLYSKRPSEAAGHAMAFNITKGPVKVLVTIPVGILFGLVFGMSFSTSRHIGNGWALFGIAVGFLLCYAIMEIIYNSDFKKLFSHKITLIASLAVTYFIFSIFAFDLFGYDSYIPSESSIKSASIVSDELEFEYSKSASGNEHGDIENFDVGIYNNTFDALKYAKASLDSTEFSDISDIREIAKRGIASKFERDTSYAYINTAPTTIVYIKWNLTNGRSVYRKYTVERDAISKYCENIYNSKDYLREKYKLMTVNASDVYKVNICEGYSSTELKALSENDRERLVDTYKKELAAMSYTDKEKARLSAILQFRTKGDNELYKKYDFDRFLHPVFNVYPLYKNMTGTLAILRELNSEPEPVNPDAVKLISVYKTEYSPEEKKSAYIADYAYSDDDAIIFTDKDQINEILKHCDPSALAINPIYDASYNIRVTYKSDDSDDLYIVADEVPTFLK